jgi:hypothetical protein
MTTLVEHRSDFGDVAHAASAGLEVEAQARIEPAGAEQAELDRFGEVIDGLTGGVVSLFGGGGLDCLCSHIPIMRKGCDSRQMAPADARETSAEATIRITRPAIALTGATRRGDSSSGAAAAPTRTPPR